MNRLFAHIRLNYGQKLFLIATLPLILTALAISVVVTLQSRQLAEREIETLEAQLIEAKRAELKNYLSIARTAFVNIYGRAAPNDERAMEQVSQILAGMLYGQDGYFFVFDYDGNNLVSPRHTELIGRNWTGLEDEGGQPITDELIRLARTGGGYHSYEWPKPSTGERAQMVTYVIGLQDWRWAVGTGVFIDDVVATVTASREKVEARVERTFFYIGAAMLAALLLVFVSGLFINIRERRLADAKLKKLTQRVFDAQEEERGRVARELHDGISQILLAPWQGHAPALRHAKCCQPFMQADKGPGDTLPRVALPESGKRLAEEILLHRRQPCQRVGPLRLVREKVPKPGTVEDAKCGLDGGLDRMLHLAHDHRLKAHKIAGQDEADNLAATILQRLVTQALPPQDSVELRALRPLHQDGSTCLDRQLADLEALHEGQFLIGERLEQRLAAQRTVGTGGCHRMCSFFPGYVAVECGAGERVPWRGQNGCTASSRKIRRRAWSTRQAMRPISSS